MDKNAQKDYYKKSKSKHNLRFYDNRPLKRLSSLFTRETQIRIKEMENSDIDYFTMQALQRKFDGQSGSAMQQRETTGFEGIGNQPSDKLIEQYLGLDSECTENVVPQTFNES